MPKKTRTPKVPKRRTTGSLVWFEIPADRIDRAKTFYGSLFGWTFNKLPAAVADYWHIDTGGGKGTPDGGLMPRLHPQQPITNYVAVPSATKAAAKVLKLGGNICKPKTAVPGMGYFVVCEDTEGNMFALWERNPRAK